MRISKQQTFIKLLLSVQYCYSNCLYHSCNIILYVINKFRPLQHTPAEFGKWGKSASNKPPSL